MITGELEYFNLAEWTPLVDRYQRAEEGFAKARGASGDTDEQPLEVRVFNARFKHALALGQPFYNAVVGALSEPEHWVFSVESDQLKGDIVLPLTWGDASAEDGGQFAASRLLMNLDYLRLPAAERLGIESQTEAEDLFSANSIEPLSVSVRQLYVGDDALGSWAFRVTPVPSQKKVVVHDVDANLHGLSIVSGSESGLTWQLDDAGNYRTAIEARAYSDTIDQTVVAFYGRNGAETVSPITSDYAEFDVRINWPGGPTDFSLDAIGGDLSFKLDKGEFLRAPDSTENILRLVGLVNFDTLVRRMRLDFSDLYSDGLSFDELTGTVSVRERQVYFNEQPIQMKGPSSKLVLSGEADIEQSTIDGELIATLPVANNLPWIAALAGGLPAAAGAFIASKVFENEVNRLSSAVYRVEGSLDDPDVEFVRLFERSKKTEQAKVNGENTVVTGDSDGEVNPTAGNDQRSTQ